MLIAWSVSGDAYRFTLQPVFLNLQREFRCHLRQVASDVLYQLWFYVTVTAADFETPRIFVTVRQRDVANLRHGRFQFHFLSVEHNSGLHADDDLILSGHFHHPTSTWNYSTRPTRPSGAAPGDLPLPMNVHGISNSVFILSTEFDEPFAYSTSTWVNENSCEKDVRRFRPAGWWASVASSAAENVNIVSQTSAAENDFQFALKSIANPPFMRFTVPGMCRSLLYYH